MAQVFGNRILGGIGAPGGGMSESFGAGVNTALGQRSARQDMRMRDIDLQFTIEDREEAKRRRAAADAAAAAARSRNAAMAARYRDILGTVSATPTTGGLTVPATASTEARDRQGPAVAPTRRPAGVRPAAYAPSLSLGTAVSGGGGQTTIGGGSGADVLGAPAQPAAAPRAISGRQQAYEQGRAAAAAAEGQTTAEQISGATSGVRGGILTAADRALGNVIGAAEGVVGGTAGAVGLGASALGMPGFGQTMLDYAGQRFTDAERLAREGYFGANAAGTAAAAPTTAPVPSEVAVTLPGGERMMLATGETPTVQQERLTFGPQLGATSKTQEDIFVDNLLEQTGTSLRGGTPLPPPMGEPGAPNKFVTRTLAERERQVQLAQAALEFQDMQTYQAAAAKIMELDVALEAGVARMAIGEARYNNAPQRLNAIWSDATNMEYNFVPSAPGTYDMYVNGELYQPGVSIETIAEETLMMSDQSYAQQQAALQQIRLEEEAKATGKAAGEMSTYEQKAAVDLVKRLREGMIDLDIETAKREYGLDDDVVINTDEATGIIYAMRGTEIVAQFRPVEVEIQGGGTYVRLEPLP